MNEKEIERILADPLLAPLANDDFSSIDYISKIINSTDLDKLVDTYFNYNERTKQIDDLLSKFAAENQEFLLSQFNVSRKYGVILKAMLRSNSEQRCTK